MLTYDEFKTTFCARFPEVMGDEYERYELKLMPVKKRGRELDGFTFCPIEDSNKIKAMPTFYFNELYEAYCDNPDMSLCVVTIAASMRNALSKGRDISGFVDLSKIKKNVIADLVNPEVASPYLFNVPHREFLNLCITYRWVLNVDESGVYSGLIDNDLMNAVNLDEEDLYVNAMKNTKRLIVPQFKTFDSLIRRMLRRDGRTESEIRRFIGKIPPEDRMYVITNKHSFRGSTALLNKGFLEKIAEKLESDYYIIPTSVNESLVIKADSKLGVERMMTLLLESNSYYIQGDEMLSDSIYYYCAEEGTLSVCDEGEVRV